MENLLNLTLIWFLIGSITMIIVIANLQPQKFQKSDLLYIILGPLTGISTIIIIILLLINSHIPSPNREKNSSAKPKVKWYKVDDDKNTTNSL